MSAANTIVLMANSKPRDKDLRSTESSVIADAHHKLQGPLESNQAEQLKGHYTYTQGVIAKQTGG
jgi:hypothetical protein